MSRAMNWLLYAARPTQAPGPSSALAAAVTTVCRARACSQRKLAWGILAEPVDVDVTEIAAGEAAARSPARLRREIEAAVRAGHLPAQDTALAATALLGALHESLVGPPGAGPCGRFGKAARRHSNRDAAGAGAPSA